MRHALNRIVKLVCCVTSISGLLWACFRIFLREHIAGSAEVGLCEKRSSTLEPLTWAPYWIKWGEGGSVYCKSCRCFAVGVCTKIIATSDDLPDTPNY